MDQAKLNKRLQNLNKVKAIVEIAKIDAIKKISKSNNIKTLHYEIANISQQIINYSRKLDRVRNKKEKKQSNGKKPIKTLWIFITLPSNLLKISYSKYEKIITNNINVKTDSIIAVGDPAITFASKNNYKILTSFQNLDGTSLKLSSLIIHAIYNQQFNKIAIVSQASKINDDFYVLYPFENVKYDYNEMKRKKFFYSLSDTQQQIFYNYIKNIIGGMYQEAYRNFHVEKLAKHESSLKSIDTKISELKLSLIKDIRKKETEEMIHIIQSLKRR